MFEGRKQNTLQQPGWFIIAVGKWCIVKLSHSNLCSGCFSEGICQMGSPGPYQRGCSVGDLVKGMFQADVNKTVQLSHRNDAMQSQHLMQRKVI